MDHLARLSLGERSPRSNEPAFETRLDTLTDGEKTFVVIAIAIYLDTMF